MHRVADWKYLYLRHGVYWFRRAVPSDAAEAFGGVREAIKSLGTRDLAEARHKLMDEVRLFESTLSQARRTIAPFERLQRDVAIPTRDDIDTAVRQWLRERQARLKEANLSLDEEGEERQQSALEGLRKAFENLNQSKALNSALDAQWIADDLIRANGWEMLPWSGQYRALVRLIVRAQVEAVEQARQELAGEPVRVLDERFGNDRYASDQVQQEWRAKAVSLQALIRSFLAERRPAAATEKSYRRQFGDFCSFLGHDRADQVSPEDVIRWKEALQQRTTRRGTPLSPKTIRDTYVTVVKAILAYGVETRRLAENPAKDIKVRGPRRVRLREKGLSDAEAALILRATMEAPPTGLSAERAFARRWVPWLCAYTGARVNEMTQLRAEDVQQIEGIWVVRVTPEAGSVKDHKARLLPLHPEIIKQGFVQEAHQRDGPLFYDPRRHRGGKEGNPQPKKVGEFLARWVREIGITDTNVQPNHGWRHRFTTLARLHGIPEEVRRAITGHAQDGVSARYGEVPLEVTYREIRKLSPIRIT